MKRKPINISPTDDSDSILLERAIRQRDRQALSILHNKYYADLERFITSRIGSKSDAQDLSQDIFLELYLNNGDRHEYHNAKAYLFGIARHLIANYIRKRTNSPGIIPIETIPESTQISTGKRGMYESFDIKGDLANIEILLAGLPPKSREALKLRFIDGLKPKDAAKLINCSVNAFYWRLHEGIRLLKKRYRTHK